MFAKIGRPYFASHSNSLASNNKPGTSNNNFSWDKAEVFDYENEDGKIVLQVGRIDAAPGIKHFRQRYAGPEDWLPQKPDGFVAPLWNLRDVLTAETILVCEGEKAAKAANEALKECRIYGEIVATTNAGGAKKFLLHHAELLQSKKVVILPDADSAGEEHAALVASLCHGKTQTTKIVRLRSLPDKGDVYDFLRNGGHIAEVLEEADRVPAWGKAKRFKLHGLSDIFARPTPEWLIEGYLHKGGTSIFSAYHATYKSFIALDMSLCIATGIQWHGSTVKQGPVVFVAAEGIGGLKNRIKAWMCHHGIQINDALNVPIHIYDLPVKLHDEKELDAFIEEIQDVGPAMIVLDTLARCAVGLEENSAGDMGRFLDGQCRLARETGAHVLVVHHNNKEGIFRGSTAIPAAIDTHISAAKKGGMISLKMDKQKDSLELPPIMFAPQVVPIPDAEERESSIVMRQADEAPKRMNGLDTHEQTLLDVFWDSAGKGQISATDWREAAAKRGVASSTCYRSITSLVTRNVVTLVSGKAGGKGENAAKYVINRDWYRE